MFNSLAAGKKVYSNGSYAPNRGQVSYEGAQGYLKRELGKPQVQGPHGGVSAVGKDGNSDTRSGIAARALAGFQSKVGYGTGGKPMTNGIVAGDGPKKYTPTVPATPKSWNPNIPGPGDTWTGPTTNPRPGVPTTPGTPGTPPQTPSSPSAPYTPSAPVAPAPPPAVVVNDNGVLELPYSDSWSQSLIQAQAEMNNQLLQLQTESQAQDLEFNNTKRDAGIQYEGLKRDTLNENASGGTAFSSRYGTAVGNNATDYNNFINDATAQDGQYKTGTIAQRTAIQNQFNEMLRSDVLQRGIEAAADAGSLGYGTDAPGDMGNGNDSGDGNGGGNGGGGNGGGGGGNNNHTIPPIPTNGGRPQVPGSHFGHVGQNNNNKDKNKNKGKKLGYGQVPPGNQHGNHIPTGPPRRKGSTQNGATQYLGNKAMANGIVAGDNKPKYPTPSSGGGPMPAENTPTQGNWGISAAPGKPPVKPNEADFKAGGKYNGLMAYSVAQDHYNKALAASKAGYYYGAGNTGLTPEQGAKNYTRITSGHPAPMGGAQTGGNINGQGPRPDYYYDSQAGWSQTPWNDSNKAAAMLSSSGGGYVSTSYSSRDNAPGMKTYKVTSQEFYDRLNANTRARQQNQPLPYPPPNQSDYEHTVGEFASEAEAYAAIQASQPQPTPASNPSTPTPPKSTYKPVPKPKLPPPKSTSVKSSSKQQSNASTYLKKKVSK